MENKQKICDLLLKALQETRAMQELERLEYKKEDPNMHNLETVTAHFRHKRTTINVEMDSGYSMVSDIIRNLKP